MKHLLGIFLFIVLLPGTVRGVDLDASMLSLCLKFAENSDDKALQNELLSHKYIQLIREGLPTHREISFDQISKHKDRLRHYKKALPAIKDELATLAAQATVFLEGPPPQSELKIRIVCGPPYDAFGFAEDGDTHLFINLPLIKPDFFPYLIRHEIWHAAYRRQNSPLDYSFESSKEPLKQLAFTMLNEGVGHYFSFQRRVEPEIVYEDWPKRTQHLFSLLKDNTKKLAAARTPEKQEALLWTSKAGVPFWEKWGAVTGAVITYRLRHKFGDATLKSLIKAGPCSFLLRYQQEAAGMANWEPLPDILLETACTPNP